MKPSTAIVVATLLLIGPACGPTCGLFRPVAKATASPAVGDQCVVGRWVDQLTDDPANWTFNGQSVHVTGMQGWVVTLSADGTEILDWSDAQPLTGTYQGRDLKIVLGGTYTFQHVMADGSHITRPAGTGTFTAKFLLGGNPAPTISAHVDAGSVPYVCSRSTMVWSSTGPQPVTTTFMRG